MSWQSRLQQMILAGGVLFVGCSSQKLGGGDAGGADGAAGSNAIPCGNANPDPCICGRPDADSEAAAGCQAEMACIASGGFYETFWMGTQPPHCEMDGGIDGASSADGGSDGNAAD
jgi:hypothetical protein